jgi:hypothetical protein
MVDVLIKNVDEAAYKTAKMLALKNEKRVGEVVSEAIVFLARQREKKGLRGVRPVRLGKGTERLSMEIDEILYGD